MAKKTYILGISAYYHDSAAAIIGDGEIIAAAQEERFTRKKHDARFPANAIKYCLKEAGIEIPNLAAITFYDKPFIKFERLLETYLTYAPKGFQSFVSSMPVWIKEKLYLKQTLKKEIRNLTSDKNFTFPKLLFTEHHQSHAASAFFPSGFSRAAVLCADGVGEWATTSCWLGENNKLKPMWEIHFPHSIGMLYSAFTYYAGFKVNSGEYKLMGLAPYGEPKYVDLILKNLIDLKEDGTFRLNMEYFNYATGLTMTNNNFSRLFGGPPRAPESPVTQKEMDIAKSIQTVTEEVMLKLARAIRKELGVDRLCLAGGVALNCVANGRILREAGYKEIWIQPAAGDAGSALGAALSTWYEYFSNPRTDDDGLDKMRGSYLGPRMSDEEIERDLKKSNANYVRLTGDELISKAVELIEQGNVIGWCQGRMEYGPRALGNRSIIGDPRNKTMQSVMNLKIKFRESFRPFAPAVLAEDVNEYFELEQKSPYMLKVAPVRQKYRLSPSEDEKSLFGIEKLKFPRSSLPAITHVDFSARVQTVHNETNPKFYALLKAFKAKTGCSILLNTSFNVRGEPIVCSAKDAYRCFMRTEMDYLILENYILSKKDQPRWQDAGNWKKEFELD